MYDDSSFTNCVATRIYYALNTIASYIIPTEPQVSSSTIRQSSLRSLERLLKVGNNIINMLRSNRDTNRIFSHTRVLTFLIRKLLVGSRPWMDSQCLRITNTNIKSALDTDTKPTNPIKEINILSQIRNQFKSINNLTPGLSTPLNPNR